MISQNYINIYATLFFEYLHCGTFKYIRIKTEFFYKRKIGFEEAQEIWEHIGRHSAVLIHMCMNNYGDSCAADIQISPRDGWSKSTGPRQMPIPACRNIVDIFGIAGIIREHA